ncbi:hypothetical protein LSUE1_G002404 [Lachnellula suecica]|uniref:AB hydrolase-1 domain-containing protein n=1 Tax=Lachnellula suecica TaxID=602035 RepID=A0A8T9CB52_9HELO|nr:hypothetical protein LSUE1_G002404 [Lachnellula suecica]
MSNFRTRLVAGILALNSVTSAPNRLSSRDGPTCTDFVIPIQASAPTQVFPQPPANITDPTALLNYVTSFGSGSAGGLLGAVGTVITSGNYNISMRYCEPQVADASRADTLQFLVHGISYDKNYWNGLGYDEYSWVDYATNQGYPTLAIDNLGNGESEHPDALLVTQMTIQVEIMHNIITMLRAGRLPKLATKFSKVLLVGKFIVPLARNSEPKILGHSYGSICGNALATHYPTDIDTFVFTGYSGRFAFGAIPLLEGAPIPAIAENPERFSSIIDPLYFAQSVGSGRTATFYTNPSSLGGFNQAAADYDFANEGTVALGEVVTIFYGLGTASDYTGNILVLTGENDAVACNSLPAPDCGSGADSVPAQAGAFFPKANYTVVIPELTGHSVTLHNTAQQSFKVAHDFLSEKGF